MKNITNTTKIWWTTVGFGGNPAPKGPWRSYEAAQAAINRWAARRGADAGTLVNLHSVRLHGYKTRSQAKDANILDIPEEIRPVWGH